MSVGKALTRINHFKRYNEEEEIEKGNTDNLGLNQENLSYIMLSLTSWLRNKENLTKSAIYECLIQQHLKLYSTKISFTQLFLIV